MMVRRKNNKTKMRGRAAQGVNFKKLGLFIN